MSEEKSQREIDLEFMKIAMDEAKKSLSEKGIPVGACLVIYDENGKIVNVYQGHNRRVQDNNPMSHGETDCIKNAHRHPAKDYRRATMYTTLSPCAMCIGTVLLYKIPRIVIAENDNFKDDEEYLRKRGVEVVNLDLPEAKTMMREFIQKFPALWNEDIGEMEEVPA